MHFLFFLSFLGWLLMQAIQNQRVTKRLSTAYEANMLENALRVSIPPLSMPATRILAALLPAPTSLMQFLTPFPPEHNTQQIAREKGDTAAEAKIREALKKYDDASADLPVVQADDTTQDSAPGRTFAASPRPVLLWSLAPNSWAHRVCTPFGTMQVQD